MRVTKEVVEKYKTLQEIRSVCAKMHIKTKEDYNERYKEDPKLCANPFRAHQAEWHKMCYGNNKLINLGFWHWILNHWNAKVWRVPVGAVEIAPNYVRVNNTIFNCNLGFWKVMKKRKDKDTKQWMIKIPPNGTTIKNWITVYLGTQDDEY